MKFFKRKNEKTTDPKQDALASKIAQIIVAKQRQLAIWLNDWAEHLGATRTLSILIFLAVTLGGYCLWLIVSALL